MVIIYGIATIGNEMTEECHYSSLDDGDEISHDIASLLLARYKYGSYNITN